MFPLRNLFGRIEKDLTRISLTAFLSIAFLMKSLEDFIMK